MMRNYTSLVILVIVGLMLVLSYSASRTMSVLQSVRGSSLSIKYHRAMQTVVSPTAPSITPSTTNSPTVYLNRVRTRSPMMSSSSGSPIMTSTIEDQTTIATEEQTNTPTTIIQSHSPKCQGSNPSTCGCSSVRQTDYRGTINTTTTGKSCIPWEDTKFYQPNDYPNAALDMNYCRNPDWSSTSYCYISEYDWEECNVPSCEELIPSSYPSISFHPTLSTLPRSSMATNESLLSSTTTSNCIEVNITYDDYPIETSWDLYRIDTGDSELIQSHTASDGDTFYSKSICLADGEYKFTIYDTDGICCDDYGDGNYTILSEDDGVVIAKGGDFELSESILFLMPYIPYPSMSPSVSNRPTITMLPSVHPSITVIPTVHPSSSPSKPDVMTVSSSYPTTRSIIQSISPSISFHPTLSTLPTSSLSPTLGPQCQGSNPLSCGCDSVRQTDYRGTINTTTTGKSCIRWDESKRITIEDYHHADLRENHCRNPNWSSNAYCYINEYDWEECDVPSCEELIPSSYPSLSFHPTLSTPPSIATVIESFIPTSTSNCIVIDIVYDDYPLETSWELYRIVNTVSEDTDELIQSHAGSDGDTSYTRTVCLQDGEYKFAMSDSGGDGICCDDYGNGNYTVSSREDGIVIANGGDFLESESTTFTMPFISYPSMSPSASDLPPFSTSSISNTSSTMIPTTMIDSMRSSISPSRPRLQTGSPSTSPSLPSQTDLPTPMPSQMDEQPPSLTPQTKVPTSLPSISPHNVTRSPTITRTTLTPTKEVPPLTTLTISSPEEITAADDESKDTETSADEWKETQVNPLSQTQLKKEEDSSGVGATLSSVHIAIHVSFLVGIIF